jgi:dimethylamine/trimethylamine dehydrogenase
MAGAKPKGHVMVYDDDHYYMASVLAELLVKNGNTVTFITPSAKVAEWSFNTLEQGLIQQRLLEIGVEVRVTHGLAEIQKHHVSASCVYTGKRITVACDAAVLVTARLPNDLLYLDLKRRENEWATAGIKTVRVVGDANAPAAIAWATYAGHRYAEELDEPDIGDRLPFKREIVRLEEVI